jgi:hypothetical protein
MKLYRILIFLLFAFPFANNLNSTSYNSMGQTGLINIPTAETHKEQSIYLTFTRDAYSKLGTLTVTPFDWLEASYFYYRPDDLLWGGTKGLYLDKGFNVKFSYKPDSFLLPRFAVGLDDFAGTGQFTKEYFVATYDFNNLKLTTGIGWGKFVGDKSYRNPLSILHNSFKNRGVESSNYELGGNLSYDLWFKGDANLFGGIELDIPKIKGLTLKVESNPFDYFSFSCCGEGLSAQSFDSRKNESDINYGISYKYKNYGNIDFSYISGNTWNVNFSIGFSAKKPLRKKNKFNPIIENNFYNENTKNEFYLDILENLNKNKLYLQTALLDEDELSITIDSADHINPIIYASRAAYIANEVSDFNNIDIETIHVGHVSRGAQINNISFRTSDLDLEERLPDVLIKRYSNSQSIESKNYEKHEFKPKVNFPIFINSLSPDLRTHIGSPEKFLYSGLGIKLTSEIQFNREFVFYAIFGRSFEDNFDEKTSDPNSSLPLVRTQVVDYLQQTSKDIYITTMEFERIWSPYKNVYSKVSVGYLEAMYGGVASEVMYKPFNSNFALSLEVNKVKKRAFDQKFSFLDYQTTTKHLNVSYYHHPSNILTKWSYGNYLAGDRGYTLDLSRRMPSGWSAGIFFSNTNVSAEDFGEGSFDKGFYFNVPMSIFRKKYNKNVNGFKLRTMTRDGGQKLDLRNRLIDSFYGSTKTEIDENWNNFLD